MLDVRFLDDSPNPPPPPPPPPPPLPLHQAGLRQLRPHSLLSNRAEHWRWLQPCLAVHRHGCEQVGRQAQQALCRQTPAFHPPGALQVALLTSGSEKLQDNAWLLECALE